MSLRKLKVAAFAILMLAGYCLYSYFFGVLPGSAYYLLKKASAPRAGQRVLVLSPHPDDESIATGGYIYTARERGAVVRIVLVTDGNKHLLRTLRYQEFRRSTAILGVADSQLRFWQYPDGHLKYYPVPLKKRVRNEIKGFKPDIILYPHPRDHHPDHAVLGRVTEKILALAASKRSNTTAYRYLVHHPYFPQPKTYAPGNRLLPPFSLVSPGQHWQVFDLSGKAIKAKTTAVHEYPSQLRSAYLRSVMLGQLRTNELLERQVP